MGMARGVCRVCGYSWALTRTGILLSHHVWYGDKSRPCEGSRQPPREENPDPYAALVSQLRSLIKTWRDSYAEYSDSSQIHAYDSFSAGVMSACSEVEALLPAEPPTP